MKHFVRITFLAVIICAVFCSCSKDYDNLPDPQTGYFVKSATVYTPWNQDSIQIGFRYDDLNRIIEQSFDEEIITYTYNDMGELVESSLDDGPDYRFIYQNGRINQIQIIDQHTDEIVDQMPVSFSNGIYSVDGAPVCKVDRQNQLLEWYDDNVVLSYGTATGVHEHLKLSAARYLVELTDEYFILDLGCSNRELTGWMQGDTEVTVNSLRNDQGLITSISTIRNQEAFAKWEIKYEERQL